jgi:2-(1,2-epoxy-1,2-dihydrophenyl)acetyl-CoA isomerase
MDKPVLAAVEGNVAGPGLSFMLACDLVLAARGTKFNCKYTSYGMPPDGGISLNLTRKVGTSKACELLMLSETFTAEQAEKWNLVNAVVDDDKLSAEALTWVDRLATGPTKAFGSVKRLVAKAFEQDLATQLSLEHTYWGGCSRSFDFREAVKAHFAKRPAKFMGA